MKYRQKGNYPPDELIATYQKRSSSHENSKKEQKRNYPPDELLATYQKRSSSHEHGKKELKGNYQPEELIATYQKRGNTYEHGKTGNNVGGNRRIDVKKSRHPEPMRSLPPEKQRRSRRIQELLEDDDVTFINHPPARRLDVVLDSSSVDAFSEDNQREPDDFRMRTEDRRMREEEIRTREEERNRTRSTTPSRTRTSVSKRKASDENNNFIDDFSLLGMKEAFSNVPLCGDQGESLKGAEDDEEIKYMERLRDTMLLVAGVGACGLALML